jgi:hypothetical protein
MMGNIYTSHYSSLQLPDEFKDFVMNNSGGKTLSGALMTHCHRELFHEQWQILLDEDFINAYQHGIVITCCDGIKHRFYPRIFTYSADYPEKFVFRAGHGGPEFC